MSAPVAVDHGVTIEPIPSQAGPAYRALCLCGYTSPSLPSRASADEAGRQHVDQSDAGVADGLLTVEQVTRLAQVDVGTLAAWRATGRGPRAFQLGAFRRLPRQCRGGVGDGRRRQPDP